MIVSWPLRGLGVVVLTVLSVALVAACGGGDDAFEIKKAVEIKNCVDFVDSFGQPVTCTDMKKLPGAAYQAVDGGGDASSSDGDAGADGTATDGLPIKNTKLMFTDINGKILEVTTNDLGQFRINLRGMKAPLLATVVRSNGVQWKSILVADIERAPKNNKFYTINLTKLTDVVASEMAKLGGLQGADDLTPQVIKRLNAEQPEAYLQIVGRVNQQLLPSLLATNVKDPINFDPVRTPFLADRTGADKALEAVTVKRDSGGTVITAVVTPLTIPIAPPPRTTPFSPPLSGIAHPIARISGTTR